MTDAGRDPEDSEGPEDGESSKEIWVWDRGEYGSFADPVAEDEMDGGTEEQDELVPPTRSIQPPSGRPSCEREASDVDEAGSGGTGAVDEMGGGTEEQDELVPPSTHIQPPSGRPSSERAASDEGAGSDGAVHDGEPGRCDGVDSTEGEDADTDEGEDEEGEGAGGGVDE